MFLPYDFDMNEYTIDVTMESMNESTFLMSF